jgi:hypothetical protein
LAVGRTQTHFDLLDACAQPGCPVCRLTLVAVSRYIDSVNYEFVNDPSVRAKIERTWAFCNTHAQQWLREGHVLGVALIYESVLARLQPDVAKARHNARPGFFAGITARLGRRPSGKACGLLQPEGACPVCRERDESERVLIAVLGEGLAEAADDFRTAFRRSDGLCLPHLRRALCTLADAGTGEVLRAATLAHQELLARQLREIVRKHDYRFRDEPSGDERGAAIRAVAHVAGLPGIVDREPLAAPAAKPSAAV